MKLLMLKSFTIATLVVLLIIQFGAYFELFSKRQNVNPITPRMVGSSVPRIDIEWPFSNGRPIATYLSDLPRSPCAVFYFFTPDCPACRTGAPEWRQVRTLSSDAGVIPVYWIMLSDDRNATREFLTEYGISTPIVHPVDAQPYHSLGVVATPSVWGVLNDAIAYVDRGYAATSPSAIDKGWCKTDSNGEEAR